MNFCDKDLYTAIGEVKPVDCSGAVIEQVSNRVELFLAVGRQVSFVGQILSQKPIGILARTSLPRAMRIAKVDLHIGACSKFRMLAISKPWS